MRRRFSARMRFVPQLDIRHLGVRYGSKTGTVDALADVNLSMSDGDFLVAIGASGCSRRSFLISFRVSSTAQRG